MIRKRNIVDKKRLNTYVPAVLFEKVHTDYMQYGVSPSHIVAIALQEYYERHALGVLTDVKRQAKPEGGAIRR